MMQHATRVREWTALGHAHILERELLEADMEGWVRGWDERGTMEGKWRWRFELLALAFGCGMGAIATIYLMVRA